jgi:beta-alanine degradation protein BauB
MRARRIALSALFLAVSFPLTVAGQEAEPAQVDPVVVSPDRFTVLLENEHVRVVEYVLLPGERDQWHTHPPKVSVVVTGGTLRITTEDGQSFLTDEKEASASWMGALGRHFAQNVGETPVRIILVEIKKER